MKKKKQVISVEYRVIIEGNLYFRNEEGILMRLEIPELIFPQSKEICKALQN